MSRSKMHIYKKKYYFGTEVCACLDASRVRTLSSLGHHKRNTAVAVFFVFYALEWDELPE